MIKLSAIFVILCFCFVGCQNQKSQNESETGNLGYIKVIDSLQDEIAKLKSAATNPGKKAPLKNPNQQSGSATTAITGKITEEQFRKLVLNKTKDQVEAILGKPTRINEHNGMSTWVFEYRYLKGNRRWQTYNPDASEPNKEEDVEFSRGRVYHVAP